MEDLWREYVQKKTPKGLALGALITKYNI